MNETDVPTSLSGLAAAEESCTRCPLYRNATQAVPGEGPRTAQVFVVGEQPGDREDLAGRPFVGPAGKLLDRALEDAGIERKTVFITNAVKHFKYEQQGKRRLHKRPNVSEVDQCRWWLDIERKLIRPRVVVGMGTTALRGLLGRSVTVSSLRGQNQELDDGVRLIATVHPSSLLRAKDQPDKEARYKAFVGDLLLARDILSRRARSLPR